MVEYTTLGYVLESLQIGLSVLFRLRFGKIHQVSLAEQITVGPLSRAEKLAKMLDHESEPFRLATERGFYTFTGRYKGVPVSVVAIGMGIANCDFFVR
jgi:purine-nucleoside phosphorylase